MVWRVIIYAFHGRLLTHNVIFWSPRTAHIRMYIPNQHFTTWILMPPISPSTILIEYIPVRFIINSSIIIWYYYSVTTVDISIIFCWDTSMCVDRPHRCSQSQEYSISYCPFKKLKTIKTNQMMNGNGKFHWQWNVECNKG